MEQTQCDQVVIKSVRNQDVQVPLYAAQPAAGFPSPGDDVVEKPLDLNDLMIKNQTATFFVRVAGDSMIGKKIFDGDILVVDRSLSATSGSIVVAAVFGELVIKEFQVTPAGCELRSANKSYDPILISEEADVHVWGVVTGTVRTFT